MLKKVILGHLLIFILICLISPLKSDKVKLVFNELDNNYKIYRVDTDNINTNNISKYFNQYTILSITPDINPIYKKAININTYRFDNNKTIKTNVKEFSDIYIDILKDLALDSEVQKCFYNGIKIKQVEVYITNNQLNEILKSKNIKLTKS